MLNFKQIFIFFVIIKCTTAIQNMTRSYEGYKCYFNMQCRQLLGDKSFCIVDECQCFDHYHINNDGKCIEDKGLHDFCSRSDECYWGPEMLDKIECSLDTGICTCADGYIPAEGRICIRYFDESAGVRQSISLFVVITLTMGSSLLI